MKQTTLVRKDLPIDDMLVTAVRYRPDLEAVRTLWAAAQADQGATIWGGLGPQVHAARTFLTPPIDASGEGQAFAMIATRKRPWEARLAGHD